MSTTALLIQSGLRLGSSYEVTVTAVNAINESLPSTALTLHTGIKPSKLTGISAPHHKASDATSITIEWLPPSYNGGTPLREYRIYHDIGQTGTYTLITLTDLNITEYKFDSSSPGASGLSSGTIVDFYMTSVNVIGESDPSDVLTLYVAGIPSQPDVPIESMVY